MSDVALHNHTGQATGSRMSTRVRELAVRQAEWTSRKFEHQLAPTLFPAVLERFRGTPVRAAELVAAVPVAVLRAKPLGKWSAQEHLGHLLDLEELGERRLNEFITRKSQLIAADMTNQKTMLANHNQKDIGDLLQRFAAARRQLVDRLEAMSLEVISHQAVHPRLGRPMNVVEWVFFMCEHDDHHLTRARELVRELMP
jgi:hypothetical protein